MRPYWTRLVAGIVLGCLCGLTAAGFVWAMRTLMERLEKPKNAALICPNCGADVTPTDAKLPKVGKPGAAMFPGLDARLKQWQHAAHETLDPWLPRVGVTLRWQQVLGGLLFLPLLALLRGATDYGSNYCMGWVSERVINDLRCDVLAKLTSLSLDYFNRSATGDMLT